MSAAAGSVRPAIRADAQAIAILHAEQISEGFLALLGPGFLTRLYRRVVGADGSFALVTTGDGGQAVTGFVAVAESTGRLYRRFLVRDGLSAALRAAPALVRHPVKVLETLRHGLGGEELEGAEILALAVAPGARGQGVGHALVTEALAELRRRGITTAHVVTATTNAAAQHTYRSCGFSSASTVELHRGVVQEVLVWR